MAENLEISEPFRDFPRFPEILEILEIFGIFKMFDFLHGEVRFLEIPRARDGAAAKSRGQDLFKFNPGRQNLPETASFPYGNRGRAAPEPGSARIPREGAGGAQKS